MNYLKPEEMILGEVYICEGRNFDIGVWFEQGIEGIRYKFGDRFLDHENHWDIEGTIKPLRVATAEEKEGFFEKVGRLAERSNAAVC